MFDTLYTTPGSFKEDALKKLSGSYDYRILPWSLLDSDKWMLYSYKDFLADIAVFPEGDAYR